MRNVENNSAEINSESRGLLKENLAVQLREAILAGRIVPGEKIIEGRWARQFGVAQVSIREALNILTTEGFVTKGHGRSARVLKLGDPEIIQIYQLRGALEGLAARLAVEMRPDLSKIQSAVDSMRQAASEGNCEALLQFDLQFHLGLCELSGNPFIVEQSRRLLVPFFAFVRMRVAASGQTTSPWDKDLEAHQRIIDLVREAEGEVAEQYVKKAMARFAKTAYDNWENRNTHAG